MDVTLLRRYLLTLFTMAFWMLAAGIIMGLVATSMLVDLDASLDGPTGRIVLIQTVDTLAGAFRIAGAIGIVFGMSGRALASAVRSQTLPVATTPEDQQAARNRLKQARRREQQDRNRG